MNEGTMALIDLIKTLELCALAYVQLSNYCISYTYSVIKVISL